MSEVKEIIVAVVGFLDRAFDAWKSFIETRQEAYNRKMDKQKRKAIDYGEKIILRLKELNIEDKELDKLIDKFFKYNN